jgi:hypothetical protein
MYMPTVGHGLADHTTAGACANDLHHMSLIVALHTHRATAQGGARRGSGLRQHTLQLCLPPTCPNPDVPHAGRYPPDNALLTGLGPTWWPPNPQVRVTSQARWPSLPEYPSQ